MRTEVNFQLARRGLLLFALFLACAGALRGETCTTQSQMKPVDRDTLAAATRSLAARIQAGDATGLRQQSVPEFARDYTAMTSLVATVSTKIAAAPLVVEQIYLLDATNLKTLASNAPATGANADGTNQDAQFFCSLNQSTAEASFLIPALPPGRYAFTLAIAKAKAPWSLAFLLRADASGAWTVAGFYPKALNAAGHDGIWYWTEARSQIKARRLWTGYLYYQEAQALLQPAGFVSSSHLDKLHKEASEGAPPGLSEGIGPDTPLVVKGANGAEFRFTALTTDDSLGADKVYIFVHLAPDLAAETPGAGAKPVSAPAPPRERNAAAMAALVSAYPELRNSFGGVWVFAESPGKNPFVTEQAMNDIH